MIVDLFAGPGGWEEGLKALGVTDGVVGIEWDKAACETARAAGHRRVMADVSEVDPTEYLGIDGLIASPPCQAYSSAGKASGMSAIKELLDHVHTCFDGWKDPPSSICEEDVRADLTLQPLRWADTLRPRWIACEQVPAAISLWGAIETVLQSWGYSTWVGVLNSANYGVPQSRKRAFLIARRDGEKATSPHMTHYDGRRGVSLFDNGNDGLKPWVTMAEGLSLGDDAPDWTRERPATTVVGSFKPEVIAAPGWRNPGDNPRQHTPDSVTVSVEEAGALQGFRRDYPWHGSKTKKHQQIGNAVCPPVAAAVLLELVRDTQPD